MKTAIKSLLCFTGAALISVACSSAEAATVTWNLAGNLIGTQGAFGYGANAPFTGTLSFDAGIAGTPVALTTPGGGSETQFLDPYVLTLTFGNSTISSTGSGLAMYNNVGLGNTSVGYGDHLYTTGLGQITGSINGWTPSNLYFAYNDPTSTAFQSTTALPSGFPIVSNQTFIGYSLPGFSGALFLTSMQPNLVPQVPLPPSSNLMLSAVAVAMLFLARRTAWTR